MYEVKTTRGKEENEKKKNYKIIREEKQREDEFKKNSKELGKMKK